MLKQFLLGVVLLLVSGCASYGVIRNAPRTVAGAADN